MSAVPDFTTLDLGDGRPASREPAGEAEEWLTPEQAKTFCPPLNIENLRYPVLGGALQRRGGTARHDAVAWGYARGADARGVDIIQNCEVTGIRREGDRVRVDVAEQEVAHLEPL